jgi:hypothetical protein
MHAMRTHNFQHLGCVQAARPRTSQAAGRLKRASGKAAGTDSKGERRLRERVQAAETRAAMQEDTIHALQCALEASSPPPHHAHVRRNLLRDP